MSQTIAVENIGPVESQTIAIPADGGVTVLRGRNGCGKTTILEGTVSLLKGKGQLSRKDGAKMGRVEGCGVTIRVGKATRRTGELAVEHLEGRLNLADLVDPRLKNPEAADAKRIKALVNLTGAVADPAAFRSLVDGDDFDRIVGPASLETDDIVVMAAAVKRDFERAARAEEQAADRARTIAASHRQTIEELGVDPTSDFDEARAWADVQEAIETDAKLRGRREEADKAAARAKKAEAAIELASKGYEGPTTAEAAASVNEAMKSLQNAEEAFRAAGQRLDIAKALHEAALDERSRAVQHENTLATWRNTLEECSKSPDAPDDKTLEAAAGGVEAARTKHETAGRVTQARLHATDAEEAERAAAEYARTAEGLRDAARATDEILSDAIQSNILRPIDGRLVLTTDRGSTFYHDLSRGEKWKLAIDIVVAAIGSDGLQVIPQEAWEGLDPDNRHFIHEHAVRAGVNILTAEASAGELRVEQGGQE